MLHTRHIFLVLLGGLLAALSSASITTGASAVSPGGGQKEEVAGQMAIIRSRQSTGEQREDAVLALLGLGLDGPKALAAYTDREISRLDKGSAKAHAKVLKSFRVDARKLVEKLSLIHI